MKPVIFITCIFSTFLMTGIIWIIQLVHYPAFVFVDPAYFPDFHQFHTQIMSFIAGPLMITELFSTFLQVLYQNNKIERVIGILSLIIIVLIFISTFFIQVPLHNQLSITGKNLDLINELVSSNWIRTLLWTVKSGLLIYLLLGQQKIESEF